DRAGRTVVSQLIDPTRDRAGNLVATKVAFEANDVPSVGYDTYYLDYANETAAASSALTTDAVGFTMENRYVRIRIDPATGAVGSLIDKRTGRESLRASGSEFPVFKGKPDAHYPLRSGIPDEYDSSKS